MIESEHTLLDGVAILLHAVDMTIHNYKKHELKSKTRESGWPGAMKVGGPATHFHACAETRVPKCTEPCMHVFWLSTLLNLPVVVYSTQVGIHGE